MQKCQISHLLTAWPEILLLSTKWREKPSCPLWESQTDRDPLRAPTLRWSYFLFTLFLTKKRHLNSLCLVAATKIKNKAPHKLKWRRPRCSLTRENWPWVKNPNDSSTLFIGCFMPHQHYHWHVSMKMYTTYIWTVRIILGSQMRDCSLSGLSRCVKRLNSPSRMPRVPYIFRMNGTGGIFKIYALTLFGNLHLFRCLNLKRFMFHVWDKDTKRDCAGAWDEDYKAAVNRANSEFPLLMEHWSTNEHRCFLH